MGPCLVFNTRNTEKVSLGSRMAKRLPERRVCIFLFWLAGKWSLWYSCHFGHLCLCLSLSLSLFRVHVAMQLVSSATLGVSHPRLGLIPCLSGPPPLPLSSCVATKTQTQNIALR